jgi:hypothetical protein
MPTRVVDQYVQPLMPRQNKLHRHLPRPRLSHVQRDALAASSKFGHELVGMVASRMDSQPNEIPRRFVKKVACDGFSQATIGAGNEDDTRIHERRPGNRLGT